MTEEIERLKRYIKDVYSALEDLADHVSPSGDEKYRAVGRELDYLDEVIEKLEKANEVLEESIDELESEKEDLTEQLESLREELAAAQ